MKDAPRPASPQQGLLVFFLVLGAIWFALWWAGYGNVLELVAPFGGR